MLPGSSTSLTALFHGCGSHLKLLECIVDGTGEVVLEVRRLQKTDISSYIIKKEQAHHISAGGKSVSLAASGKQISKNCCQTFEGRRTIRTQTCCVCPIDLNSTVLPVFNGVVSITSGLNRTGNAYYSQMRVGSVCHRIVDAN
ncbi:hypothetical protein TNCV_4932811 [Trichonephila clavipes]|nr:hypothetical protein TNCV_4932811 [Trichonephila clavipes]